MFTSKAIRDRIIRIECPGDVFSYLVIGEEKALLIDTGFGYGSLKEYVDNLTPLPYEVLLTHGHLDHAGGASEFEKAYISEADIEITQTQCSREVRYETLKRAFPDIKLTELQATPIEDRLEPISGETTFYLGGIDVFAFPMPGHTKGYLGIIIKQENIIMTGDGLCSVTILSFPQSLCVRDYLATLKMVKREYWSDDSLILYSHPHNWGSSTILDEMIEVCEKLLSGEITGTEREEPYAGSLIAYPMNGAVRRDGKAANISFTIDKL